MFMDTSIKASIHDRFGAILLAGGLSSRMHQPKPWLLTRDGLTFAESIVRTFHAFGCQNIVFVINHAFVSDMHAKDIDRISQMAKVVRNNDPNLGRFHSLKLAAQHLHSSDYVFVQNVDNPFMPPELLTQLAHHKKQNGYAVPTFHSKGGHPILLSQSVVQYIQKSKGSDHDLRSVLRTFERKNVAVPWEEILLNINTKDAYDRYITLEASANICYHAD